MIYDLRIRQVMRGCRLTVSVGKRSYFGAPKRHSKRNEKGKMADRGEIMAVYKR